MLLRKKRKLDRLCAKVIDVSEGVKKTETSSLCTFEMYCQERVFLFANCAGISGAESSGKSYVKSVGENEK